MAPSVMVMLLLTLLPVVAEAQADQTVYLSDRDSVYRQLENLQRGLRNNLFGPSKGSDTFDHRTIKAYLTDLARDGVRRGSSDRFSRIFYTQRAADSLYQVYFAGDLTTRYQEPITFYQMSNLMQKMQRVVAMLYPECRYVPKFGTQFSNGFSNERQMVGDDYLIISHYRFLLFCQQMAQYAIYPIRKMGYPRQIGGGVYYGVNPQVLESTISHDQRLKDQFLGFMKGMIGDQISTFKLADTSLNTRVYFQMLTDAMEWFADGHEYGHAIKKHDLSGGPDTVNDEYTLQSWENELQADSIGLTILLRRLEIDPTVRWQGAGTFMEWGGVFFLECLYFYDDLSSVRNEHQGEATLGPKEFDNLSRVVDKKRPLPERIALLHQVSPAFREHDHPPTLFRMDRLATQLENYQSKKLRSIRDPNWRNQEMAMFQFGRDMVHSIGTLFDQDLPSFKK